MSKEYRVTIVRITEKLSTNRIDYVNTHKKGEDGDDVWAWLPSPDKMVEEKTTVLELMVPDVDLAKIFEAVTSDK